MLGLFLLNLACLAALLLLLYAETLWSRLCVLLLVVGIALGWLPIGGYGQVLFALACFFTAFASFRMEASRPDKIILSVAAILVGLSFVVRIAELPLVTAFLFIMWLPAAACSSQFIKQIRNPGDQTGILLILSFECWFQAVQIFKI
ncbi:MAG: hypothetical protein ACYC1Q_06160 [Bacteroidia bacterium]